MDFTPAERAVIYDLAAEKLVAEIKNELKAGLDEIITIPLSAAAQMIGMGSRTAAKVLPVTDTGQKERGISLAALKRHQQQRTTQPTA